MAPATEDVFFGGDSGNVGDQMAAAAESSPDFFVVHGCSSLSDVQSLQDKLEKMAPRKIANDAVDTRGFALEGLEDKEVGFDIPVVLVASSMESFKEIMDAASKVPQIVCISSPEPLGESDRAEFIEYGIKRVLSRIANGYFRRGVSHFMKLNGRFSQG